MNSSRQTHLTYDEQLRAVVDAADLPGSRRRHLSACETCRHEVDGLEHRFVRIGKIAENLAPAPKHPFRLPRETARSAGRRFNPIWATGAVAALMLITVLWWPGQFAPDHVPGYALHDVTPQQLADDRELMAEVDALIKNALPEPFRELAASSAPPTDLDEDLINWIVPSIEEEASLT
jgi:hypothetical protein